MVRSLPGEGALAFALQSVQVPGSTVVVAKTLRILLSVGPDRPFHDDEGDGGAASRATGGLNPVGAAAAGGGVQRRGGAAAAAGVGVPGPDEAGDLHRRVPGGHLPVRELQPVVLRRRVHIPRPVPALPARARRRLVQRPQTPHHVRPHRRQVRRGHVRTPFISTARIACNGQSTHARTVAFFVRNDSIYCLSTQCKILCSLNFYGDNL
jgi:hypothetical protein